MIPSNFEDSKMRLWKYVGPAFGYYVNPMKTWLVMKEDKYDDAVKHFEDTGVQITTNGKGYI